MLSDAERRKLDEADKLFAGYKPSVEEIDGLSNKWGERKSKKEVLSTKRANAELFKNASSSSNGVESSNKTIGIALLVIGIVVALGGLIAILATNNVTIGAVIVGIGVIVAIAGVILSSGKSKDKTVVQENSAYDQMMDEIAKDEEFITGVESICKELFEKMGVDYSEYDVPSELIRFRGLIKDYDELLDRSQKAGSVDREADIKTLIEKITAFLGGYKIDVDSKDYQKALYQLKNDASECLRLAKKQETMQKALKEGERIGDEIKDYLRKIGFDTEEDLKNQLSKINEKCISLEYSKEDYEKCTKRKAEFEEENDVSKYSENLEQSENLSLEDLNKAFNSLKDEIDAISELEDNFREQMDDAAQKLEDVESDEAELANLQETCDNAMRKYQIIAKTKDYLEKAKQNFSSKYMDDIKESFEKYHNMISGSDEKYELDANLNIQLQEKGSLHEIGYLSEGYKDLVGLCRRMAMVDAMYDLEKPFLIFDDPFVNLDESRLTGAIKFLDNLSKDYQIVYFSCHQSRCK